MRLHQGRDARHFVDLHVELLGDLVHRRFPPQFLLDLALGLGHVVGTVAQAPGQMVHAAKFVEHGAAHTVFGKGRERRALVWIVATGSLQQGQRARRPQIVVGALHAGSPHQATGDALDQLLIFLQQRGFFGRPRRGTGVCGNRSVHGHANYRGTEDSRNSRCHISFMPPSTMGGGAESNNRFAI